MKKILIPMNLEQIQETSNLVDGYIIGIQDMSVNTFYNINIDEIDKIQNIITEKDVFISLNKNMENKDIDLLKKILVKLKQYNIAGILYCDVCFINLKKELNLKYPLIWNQEHLSTNYETINYWKEKGVDYCYISSDIPIKDVLEIKNNCSLPLFANILGYLPMFISKRHIVKNYLRKFKLQDNSPIYYMEKEHNTYPIIDNDIGTQVFSSKIFNGISEYVNLENNNISYGVISGFLIDNDKLLELLKLIARIKPSNLFHINEQIKQLLPNNDTAFMYQDTLSKVKNNDK